MDRQIVVPGLNINIKEIHYTRWRTRLATRISKWKENIFMGIAAALIVARHRIVMLDVTVLSLKNLVQF